jgi:hypothetical protein
MLRSDAKAGDPARTSAGQAAAPSSRNRARPSAKQRLTLVKGTVCTGLRLPPLEVPFPT